MRAGDTGPRRYLEALRATRRQAPPSQWHCAPWVFCVLASLALRSPSLAAEPDALAQQGPSAGAVTIAVPVTAQREVIHAEPDRSQLAVELLFDGDVVDTSPSPHTCTTHGTLAFAEGREGKCAALDGQSWVATSLLQEELGNEFTVECWVNPATGQNPHADIFGNHVGQGLGFVLQQEGSNTNEFLAAYGAGAGKWVTTDPVSLASGTWQHVALVRTQADLRFYLNGVLVVARQDAAPALPSDMPVSVGLGYPQQDRCFRGLIDSLRIWKGAVTTFPHAGIDPADARDTSARFLGTEIRPAAGPLVKTWSLSTSDTHMTLGVTARDELVVSELSCGAIGRNWITNPTTCRFPSQVDVAGQSQQLHWRFVEALTDPADGQTLTLRFTCDDPLLEAVSKWHADKGSGPIHHSMYITNGSQQTITIADQPTFDLDLSGATDLWSFHSGGGTPDGVGVYRRTLADDPVQSRYTVRTVPTGEFIPYLVLDAEAQHGVYLGLEWSYCRIEAVSVAGGQKPTLRVRGGEFVGRRMPLAAGETFEVRPGFLGAYAGDVDDAGNSLRRWLFRNRVPDIVRQDPSYPKVQWNAFGATGKSPGSWDPVESKYYPFIDDIAPLGFEEVMIDVAWWQGNEPDSDQADWPSGMKKAADYAHQKGLRFGLYWTDDLDMATAEGRKRRAERVTRLFREYHADLWRSDSTRGEVIGASYAATLGFYQMVDTLAQEIPGFQWENCSGGGRIKDYGAMRRAVKIFNSDTYSPLHVRQAFHDSSYALHPAQLEGHLGSVDGLYRPQGAAGMRYAFRSTSMGAPEWFLDAPNGGNGSQPWTQEEKDALRECVDTYKTRIRPLVREANLYHIFPRGDGRHWDGIEYYDPVTGKGVVFLFQPSREAAAGAVRFKGLDPARTYELTFQDGSHPPTVRSGAELMNQGLPLTLPGDEVSELIFFELLPDTRQ